VTWTGWGDHDVGRRRHGELLEQGKARLVEPRDLAIKDELTAGQGCHHASPREDAARCRDAARGIRGGAVQGDAGLAALGVPLYLV
jgi:hypothetical protein